MHTLALVRRFVAEGFRWLGLMLPVLFGIDLRSGSGHTAAESVIRTRADNPGFPQDELAGLDTGITGVNPSTGLPMLTATLDVAGKHWGDD